MLFRQTKHTKNVKIWMFSYNFNNNKNLYNSCAVQWKPQPEECDKLPNEKAPTFPMWLKVQN